MQLIQLDDISWHAIQRDKLTGNRKSYYKSGKLWLNENYKDGNKHGNCKRYYGDGRLSHDHNYKNGQLHGNCKWYYRDGTLRYDYNFKEGVKV